MAGFTCKAVVETLPSKATPAQVLLTTLKAPRPAVLETLQPTPVAGRYSVFANDPVDVITLGLAESALDRFAETTCRYPRIEPCEIPYAGGWIGHISYEAGAPAHLVKPRSERPFVPAIQFGLYDHMLVYDHLEQSWWGSAIEWPPGLANRAPAIARLSLLREQMKRAEREKELVLNVPAPGLPGETVSRSDFKEKIKRVREHIEAGDIYQANLAQRFFVRTQLPFIDQYLAVRKTNPAAFAAFLSGDDHAIISASPELFLQVRERRVITRPIKGTRPRFKDEQINREQMAELAASDKDRAELNMIIDLLRNDLGMVCEFGSVRVLDPGTIEEHPTVFHRVASIEGRLAPGRTVHDLLKAMFPGGSIVGAPKIRAMQMIRDFEPFARGPYCGVIGWIGLNGDMTLNIAIRTMVAGSAGTEIFAGAGIVAESDPEMEYEEILAKAAGLFTSLKAETCP